VRAGRVNNGREDITHVQVRTTRVAIEATQVGRHRDERRRPCHVSGTDMLTFAAKHPLQEVASAQRALRQVLLDVVQHHTLAQAELDHPLRRGVSGTELDDGVQVQHRVDAGEMELVCGHVMDLLVELLDVLLQLSKGDAQDRKAHFFIPLGC